MKKTLLITTFALFVLAPVGLIPGAAGNRRDVLTNCKPKGEFT